MHNTVKIRAYSPFSRAYGLFSYPLEPFVDSRSSSRDFYILQAVAATLTSGCAPEPQRNGHMCQDTFILGFFNSGGVSKRSEHVTGSLTRESLWQTCGAMRYNYLLC
jgi:hypothetical protein